MKAIKQSDAYSLAILEPGFAVPFNNMRSFWTLKPN